MKSGRYVRLAFEVLHRCPGDENSLIPYRPTKEAPDTIIQRFNLNKTPLWGTLYCPLCMQQVKTEFYMSGEE